MLSSSIEEGGPQMKRFSILAVVAALGLTACATGAASTVGPRSDGPTAVATPSPKKAASCEAVSGGSERKVANLVDVRVGTHAGYDRVSFEFAPPSNGKYFGLPPYELKAATLPIVQDGSGEPVDVEGDAFAALMIHGASGVDFTGPEGYEITYDGPKEFRPGYAALVEATRIGDFEAVLSWAFGLNQGSCWTVAEMQDPLRLVIDFSR
jgi:hypothetical protein